MLRKIMAAFVAVSMTLLSVAPAAEAQSRRRRARPYVHGYSGTPLQRVHKFNQGMTDGLLMELPGGLYTPRGRYGSPYFPQEQYGFWNDPGYFGYGYDNPYAYGDYDWAYDQRYSRWNYRRHRSNDVWKVLAGGAVGFVLGRVTAPKAEKPQAPREAPVPVPQTILQPTNDCITFLATNASDTLVLFGTPGSETGVILDSRQTTTLCMTPSDCVYKRVGNQWQVAEQGDIILSQSTIVVR